VLLVFMFLRPYLRTNRILDTNWDSLRIIHDKALHKSTFTLHYLTVRVLQICSTSRQRQESYVNA